jgi:hypothetical protein
MRSAALHTRGQAVMDATRAASITKMLLRKTVANGCTPGEAAAAAERVALYVRRYGIEILTKSPATPPVEKPEPQANTPLEAEYAAWRAQFGTTPYRYATSRRRRRLRSKSGPWVRFVVVGFWVVVLVCLVIGVTPSLLDAP